MTPTARLAAALAAYRPGDPRWQQQSSFNEVRRAAEALAEKLAETEARLHAQWDWLEANGDSPEHDDRERGWLALNDRYEAAHRLLGEATAMLKEATR